MASSVFTITAMAVDRYLAITKPFGFCRWFNKKTTIIIIVVLWLTSMVVFAPLLFVGQLMEETFENVTIRFCQENWTNFYLSREIFGVICYVVMFAVPGEFINWFSFYFFFNFLFESKLLQFGERSCLFRGCSFFYERKISISNCL